ncbi:methyl-accepting chemotaxis protein [Moritella sp. 5]|uniref:methyl-accepting chemotaxis protein n=1 Tax=Moritella sp. 5 TaxID=2746231 RepID=UPI001BA5B754|nr:methyl-accepting chemotaxis protein [Moritella sp. 5]QUM82009.1 methyl-accepting chemotaxis protein [Moritella sp. 5]
MHLGFKARINISVAILVTISMVTLGMLNINTLKKDMVENLTNTTTNKVEQSASLIETWITSRIAVINNSAPHFSQQLTTEQNLSLVRVIAESSGISNIAVAYENGTTFVTKGGDNGVLPVSDTFKQRDWYKLAKSKGKTSLSDIYIDSITKKQVISIASPVYDNGIFTGVLLGDLQLDEAITQVQTIRFAGGAATLADNHNRFIASDDPSDLGKTPSQIHPVFAPLETAFNAKNQGVISFFYLNTDFDGYFKRINLTDEVHWTLMVFINKATVMTTINSVITESISMGIALIILSIFAIIIIVKRIYEPVLALKIAVLDLASGTGDLTRRLEIKGQDDLADIGQGFNDFVSNLQDMMLQVVNSTSDISSNVEQLGASAQQNETVLLSHSSETEQIVTAIHEMSATANSVAESIQQSAEIAESTKQEATRSQIVVNNAVNSVASLVDDVDEMAQRIQLTNDNAHQIGSVLSVIGGIADQTNLLALNAAIEAARAGEQGRGFSVVADEVRALAARTQESTAEINDMLTKLLSGTTTVVEAMETTKASCQTTAETTAEVSGSLDSMSASVIQIDDLGSQIATAAEEQSSVAEEVNRNMLVIREIVNELVQSGHNNLEATESLAQSNQTLLQLVSQFKLQ